MRAVRYVGSTSTTPSVRSFSLIVAGASKAIFGAVVLSG